MTPPLRRFLGMIGTEVAYRWTSTRWTLRAFRLRATGRHGAFQHPARTPDVLGYDPVKDKVTMLADDSAVAP